MAAPTANRPRAATLLGAVAAGLALAWLLHVVVPVASGGALGELQHLAVAPLLALFVLVAAGNGAPGAGRGVPDRGTALAVMLLAAAGHEALEIGGELVAQRGGGAFEHLTHAAPPALALLVPALAAATGLSRVLVLTAGRIAAPAPRFRVPGPVTGPRATPGGERCPQPPRAGRSAGRAPPRLLQA